mmetsp:Transcript_54332/g.117594  ORF Transcript_54332/g.117594 Transcript_54332/m.117594 type:complete len:129 (-) Transcript_54332:41-427(-)
MLLPSRVSDLDDRLAALHALPRHVRTRRRDLGDEGRTPDDELDGGHSHSDGGSGSGAGRPRRPALKRTAPTLLRGPALVLGAELVEAMGSSRGAVHCKERTLPSEACPALAALAIDLKQEPEMLRGGA